MELHDGEHQSKEAICFSFTNDTKSAASRKRMSTDTDEQRQL